jgi:hypothetical protein
VVLEATVGWLALLVAALVLVGICLLMVWLWPQQPDQQLRDEARSVCSQYANLDLSGMVKMCQLVGFQQAPEDMR